MTSSIREERRSKLRDYMVRNERTRIEGVQWLSEMIHVSTHTVEAWLKPETSKSSNEIPAWAVELIECKEALDAMRHDLLTERKKVRKAAIEDAAKVADGFSASPRDKAAKIAAAIRELK